MGKTSDGLDAISDFLDIFIWESQRKILIELYDIEKQLKELNEKIDKADEQCKCGKCKRMSHKIMPIKDNVDLKVYIDDTEILSSIIKISD